MNKSLSWMSTKGGDKYYRLAKRFGKPSRAYFKIRQIDLKHKVFEPGMVVIDLGSSPGGWVSYELNKVAPQGRVVAVDLADLRVKTGPGLLFLKKDALQLSSKELLEKTGSAVDVFLSDMAPRFSGVTTVDMARHYELATKAFELADATLRKQGWFIVKLFISEDFKPFLGVLKRNFASVKIEKPDSSRRDSSEVYAVCKK